MKRVIAALISAGLLLLLLWQVDTAALWANLKSTNWLVFAVALLLFIPQTGLIAWRWKRLMAPFAPLELAESARMVLAGATMNLVLPGKLGDLTKGYFLAQRGSVGLPLGLGVVVFEKMLDVATLAGFMLVGVGLLLAGAQNGNLPIPMASLLLAGGLGLAAVIAVALLYFVPLKYLPGMENLLSHSSNDARLQKLHRLLTGSHSTMNALQSRGSRRGEIILLSVSIWIFHLLQIYLFFRCLGAVPTPGEFFSMVPLSIFIGLVPVSIAGFGTRDAALVTLLPALPSSLVLAASFYINLRYVVPALAGIPFLARYATARRELKSRAAK